MGALPLSRASKIQIITMLNSPVKFVAKPSNIAATVGVHRRTVYNVRKCMESIGDVCRPRHGKPRKLDPFDILYIESLIEWKADLFLYEIRDLLIDNRRVEVSVTTIFRTLRQRGFTYKKIARIPLERDEDNRDLYKMHIGLNYRAEQLVFVDESGTNRHTTMRRYAWAPVGDRARRRDYFIRGKKYSILPAISLSGVLFLSVIDRAYTGHDFNTFIDGLLDNMNPFPAPNSVIVMDNASIHKSALLRPMIEQRGMRLEYLPPYSPDFDPIEEGFSAMKAWLRRNQDIARLEFSDAAPHCDPYGLIWRAVYESMTVQSIYGWYYHAGYI